VVTPRQAGEAFGEIVVDGLRKRSLPTTGKRAGPVAGGMSSD
jgi:hypothetical protein